MAMLLYGSGLPLNECLSLTVKDIDYGYNQILIRSSKGDKDRITVLPEKVKKDFNIIVIKSLTEDFQKIHIGQNVKIGWSENKMVIIV